MIDPISAHESVRDEFLRYIQTAFGTRYPAIEEEREALLSRPGAFCQPPWIEPLPRYRQTGKGIDSLTAADVPGLSPEALAAFRRLAACGLVGGYPLYTHQLRMLHDAAAGRNAVVTAGTGSGKTESFLLPLFAQLASESRTWTAPGPRHAHADDWWRSEAWQAECGAGSGKALKRSFRVSQRYGETRPAAVRALVLYPMNALVEDQLTRLRKALDSDAAREFYREACNANRIYFGRYNGSTPVAGHEETEAGNPDKKRIERLRKVLVAMEQAAEAAEKHVAAGGDPDARFFFPKLDGSEMRSRWDMQETPPDILITNYSMLSIMLMRDADAAIFDRTREWLQQDGSVFHLIIDELHLYRGTAGTEVAYLLRLLLNRLGLSPSSPKLRILASSASLDGGDPASLEFLHDFFGVDWAPQQIIPGEGVELPPGHRPLPAKPFVHLGRVIASGEDLEPALCATAEALGAASATDGVSSLREALQAPGLLAGARMLYACMDGGATRAVSESHFAQRVFDSIDPAEEADAVRGLFYARQLCPAGPAAPLPSFRFHWFFRNIEGLWSCTRPNCCRAGERPVGQLFERPRILCAASPAHRVLETLYCEQCGTVYLGGSRFDLPDNAGWELLNTDPDVESLPDRAAARLVERRSMRDYAVFWPGGTAIHDDAVRAWAQPRMDDGNTIRVKWKAASLDTTTARVVLGHEPEGFPDGKWVHGFIFLEDKEETPEALAATVAMPSVCASCAADYQRRRRPSPVRGFRTGFSKVSQILSKELFQVLPDADARKLVVFSDSREDAASIANGIERNHYADLVRETIYDELLTSGLGEAAFLLDVRAHGEARTSEARDFVSAHPAAADALRQDIELAESEIPASVPQAMRAVLIEAKSRAAAHVAVVAATAASRTIRINRLFEGAEGDPRDPGSLILRLKNLGVNPAGNDVLYQEFKYDNRYHHWTTLFEWPEGGWRQDLPPAAADARTKMQSKVRTEVSSVLFSRLYFGFESSGLGYARLHVGDADLAQFAVSAGIDSQSFADITAAILRILGDFYRYPDDDYRMQEAWTGWEYARAHFRHYLEACAQAAGVAAGELRSAVWDAVVVRGNHAQLIMSPRDLAVRVATATDPVWV
ncbi:MAG TPA: DEAD/DEAH box helicase, partial [Thermoanaerobaculia bacterium]